MDVLVSREAGCRERPPDGHAEDAGQLVDPILHPLAPMLERPTRQPILAAEKGAAHAARDAVKSTGRTGWYQNRAGVGHGTHHRPRQSSCQSENGVSFCRRFPTKWVSIVVDQIPVSARLMALADVYDALISRRVYKAPMSHEQAVAIIVPGKASHFDPDIVDAFVAIQDEFARIAERYGDPEPVELEPLAAA